jgi:hypothetical protein
VCTIDRNVHTPKPFTHLRYDSLHVITIGDIRRHKAAVGPEFSRQRCAGCGIEID